MAATMNSEQAKAHLPKLAFGLLKSGRIGVEPITGRIRGGYSMTVSRGGTSICGFPGTSTFAQVGHVAE